MSRYTRRATAILAVAGITLAACGGDDEGATAPTPVVTEDPGATTESSDTTTPATTTPTTTTPATTTPPTTAVYTDDPYTEVPADTTTSDPTESDADGALVELAETELGPVLVAADGLTLYLFTPDPEGVPTCVGPCAGTWPPYLVDDGVELTAGEGLDGGLLSTAEHPDGGTMLVYGGWPLYYYAADQAPGDVEGQGVSSVWWAVDAAGAPVTN